MPGATPASTILITLFFFARGFRSKTFSGANEISTTCFPASIIVFNVSYPKNPGTANKTISAG